MTLLEQPAYMAADARPPALPRECSRWTGEPKATYPSNQRARRVLRAIRISGLHSYVCARGHRHIGHAR